MSRRSKRGRRDLAPVHTRASVVPLGENPGGDGSGFLLPYSGGWLPADAPLNFWQMGMDVQSFGGSATVQACISAYAQTVAMCPPAQWRAAVDKGGKPTGGRDLVTTSALSRILIQPNAYQSVSDLFLNLTHDLYSHGEVFAYGGMRNSRFEVTQLHLMDSRQSWPRLANNGEIFYHLGGNEIVDRMVGRGALEVVPARDVLHIRLHTPRNPLEGEPPLYSALTEAAASNTLIAQALAFARNQNRPSGAVQTDLRLEPDQMADLSRIINEKSRGLAAGGMLVLANGLKWNPITTNYRDAQLAELLQISDQRIASVYRVPLALLSLLAGNGPQGSTESLMLYWVATGLGFCLNHIEEAFGRFFGLAGAKSEYLELDTEALLRSSWLERIEGLARGVQGGVYSPDEARAREELPKTPFGDEPRVQQQVVPLSAWGKQLEAPAQPPGPQTPPAAPSGDAPTSEEQTQEARDAFRSAAVRQVIAASKRYARSAA